MAIITEFSEKWVERLKFSAVVLQEAFIREMHLQADINGLKQRSDRLESAGDKFVAAALGLDERRPPVGQGECGGRCGDPGVEEKVMRGEGAPLLHTPLEGDDKGAFLSYCEDLF